MILLRLDGLIEKPLPEYFEMVIDAAWAGVLEEPAVSVVSDDASAPLTAV